MDDETLLERTYRLLDASELTLPAIARAAGVNYHWLCKFAQRRHRNPGVNTVERLYRYLESAPAGLVQ